MKMSLSPWWWWWINRGTIDCYTHTHKHSHYKWEEQSSSLIVSLVAKFHRLGRERPLAVMSFGYSIILILIIIKKKKSIFSCSWNNLPTYTQRYISAHRHTDTITTAEEASQNRAEEGDPKSEEYWIIVMLPCWKSEPERYSSQRMPRSYCTYVGLHYHQLADTT